MLPLPPSTASTRQFLLSTHSHLQSSILQNLCLKKLAEWNISKVKRLYFKLETHGLHYSSTFSFHHQWLSDDNRSGCTRSAHAAAEASAMPGHPWQTHQPTSQTLNRLKKVLILQKCSFSKNNILLSFSSYTEGQVNLSTHILSLGQNATFTIPKLISSRKPSAN